MRRIPGILTVILFVYTINTQSQTFKNDPSILIESLFKDLLSSRTDSEKIVINDSIRAFIDSYARSDSSFTHRFTNLKYLGQITSGNSQLKIITWNLLLDSLKSKYFCYFIHRSGKKNMVYSLSANYQEGSINNDREYSGDDWYGALYYDLRSYKKDKETYWVLLGIDYGNPSMTRKVIDVLSLRPYGRIILGKKIFVSGKETRFREVFEYSAGAVMSLKFSSDKSIVFDHLVPFTPSEKGKKESYGPDYSYDAYNLEKSFWKLKTDIDIRNKK